jgi:leader peptidase (prepilin peptidase)/N-methyltransferase
MLAAYFYSDGMLVAIWIAFLLVMLFLLGSAVGSFLNVCIVRLPEGRSLIRPGSSCGNCHKPIRMEDNLPLVSYWLLRGRCRQCGAPFSMRYFWIELLTGLLFVAIFHLEIGRNIHHFDLWFDGGYSPFEAGQFPRRWFPLFVAHALMVCFLIVAAQCNRERHFVPPSVTWPGILVGLIVAVLCPWPWPNSVAQATTVLPEQMLQIRPPDKPYEWGPRVGAMPAGAPWWGGDVTPPAGLYSWPVWGPLPDGLPPGSWQLGLATGLAGVVAGAVLTGLVRLLFNAGTGTAALGWGEVSLMMIAGAFLGWQPVVVAGLIALIPGLAAATVQWAVWKRQRVTYSLWLALALVPVWLGWYWIGPLVQGLFFNQTRLLLFATGCVAWLLALTAGLRLAVARRSART